MKVKEESEKAGLKLNIWGAVPRWWRSRMGRPLSPPQIHKGSSIHEATSTKQLLYAGGGPQIPRKANQSL